MSRTDCYTATASHCRGDEISLRAEQTVTLLLPLIAGVVRSLYTSRTICYTATVSHCRGGEISLHEQNSLLHCYCLSLQGWCDLNTNRTDCYTATVSLQGWCDLFTSRTDCYTSTVSHCRGGEISARPEQTVTLLLPLIAGVVQSLCQQNRLLHCYCLSLQGW